MKTISWGMIGCGDVTEVKSGPGFYKAEHSKLTGVFSRNFDRAKKYAIRHNIPKVYKNIDELIGDKDIDIVYIATPPASHKEYAIKCAKAGKPAYIEKPMARTYKDCLDIAAEFKKTDTPIFIAYYRRAMERFVKVKEIIDSGSIGDVRFVNVTLYQKPADEDYDNDNLPWRLIPEISGGGKFLDMGIHTIDILDFIFGPMIEVTGQASNQAGLYEVEDIVTASWKFQNNIHGVGTWCFTSFKNYDRFEVVGSRGRIYFEFFSDNAVYVETENTVKKYKYDDPEHVEQPFIQTIVNELCGNGKCPGNLQSALRANKIMDDILKKYREEKNFREFV